MDGAVSDATKSVASRLGHSVARWRIQVTAGPSQGLAGLFAEGVVRVGSAKSNDLVIADDKVSRHHLVLEVRPTGLRVRDLRSKNGTYYRGSKIEAADLPSLGSILAIGDSEISIIPDDPAVPLAPSPRDRCGRMLGQSEVMRLVFAQIERIAPTTATVLLQGETGTGKELAAEAIHALSGRAEGPMIVVDCGSIPRELIESELFGHVRGAFTGAVADRRGAFELANGGTLFLDEIGELPLDLQPRLLRALETSEIKPVGGHQLVECDVRVIAASHRDLAAEVRDKRFREDLYYRLAVFRIDLPPLRERTEDLVPLADTFLQALGAPPLGADALRTMSAYEWPGNVRQLRNVLERAVAMANGGPISIRRSDLESPPPKTVSAETLSLPYKAAKDVILARFTREYLEALLAKNGGNVSAAARDAQVDRNWIVALARRHGVRVRD